MEDPEGTLAYIVASCYYLFLGDWGDVVLLILSTVYHGRHALLDHMSRHADILSSPWTTATATVFVLGWLLWLAGSARGATSGHQDSSIPLKAMLFPCRTKHTRLIPKKHSFNYSYLLVGLPVGWTGNAGGMIATSSSEEQSRAWFQIDPADYLERGHGRLGLRGKLDEYLRSQGEDPSSYTHAYLVTAAKFLGYHFNPVSFWYLYSATKDMTAMILEVNNTFDERRMYFLRANGERSQSETENIGEHVTDPREEVARKPFRKAWAKDFHVSPFNSRKGDYSLVAYDPWAPMLKGTGLINNTINLTSSKAQAKLVARIFSDGMPLDPGAMSRLQKARFLASWWWVGFVTFPRIVKEAGRLFFRRKLHVWYRPEPLKESIGRVADDTERQLEAFFRRYLRFMVHQSQAPLSVRYIPSGVADASDEVMVSPTHRHVSVDGGKGDHLDFKVLTPVFYTRFVHYAHDLEALFSELNESSTIHITRPDLLPKLLFKKPQPPLQMFTYADYGYFKLIQRLRRRPDRIQRPMTSSEHPQDQTVLASKKDLRQFRLSSMDGYILLHEGDKDRILYRSLVARLFIADQVAFGSPGLLWLYQAGFRIILAWWVTSRGLISALLSRALHA